MPTFYTGTHKRNEGFFGKDRAIDPNKYFIVSINMFGNGLSSSPSNTPTPNQGPNFPLVTLWDNVACQHKLLTEHLGIKYIEEGLFFSIIIAIIYFIAFLISLYLVYKKDFLFLTFISSLVSIFCLSSLLIFVSPQLKSIWISEKIYYYVKEHKIERPVILLGYAEPSVVFRLVSDTLIANNVEELLIHLRNGKKNLLIVENKFEDMLVERLKIMDFKVYKHDYKIEGINYSKGKRVVLSIYSN